MKHGSAWALDAAEVISWEEMAGGYSWALRLEDAAR